MANRGIYGSLSSFPVDMGDCGWAYIDISPVTPNLCFEIPLITTGGAKPLSLSLLYNELTAQSSGGPFRGGFLLSLYRLIPLSTPSVSTSITVDCPDGPSRTFSFGEGGYFRSPDDPVAFKRVSGGLIYRAYLNPTDYLEYSINNPYPTACASKTAGTPSFTASSLGAIGPGTITLEGGRRLVFSYDPDQGLCCVSVREEKGSGDDWATVQSVVLDYEADGDSYRLSRVRAYLGAAGNGSPFRDVSFSKDASGRSWTDNLRSLTWSFAWDSSDSRVASFSSSYPIENQQTATSTTSIAYSAHSATVAAQSGHARTTYFNDDIPYMACDEQGVAEAFRYDGAKRRLLYRSGPVCLNAFSPLNENQPLLCPFFGTGSASAWSLPSGCQTQDPEGIGPAPYPDNTEAVLTASCSQEIEVSGLPGDSYTAFALIRGAGVPLALSSELTLRLIDSSSAYSEASSALSLFTGAQGRPELLAASATAKASFDRVAVSVEGPDAGVVVEAVLLLKRPAPLSARYDAEGRLVSGGDGPGGLSVLYRDEAHPYLIGGPHSFARFGLPSTGQECESVASRSAWGLHSVSLKNLSTHLTTERRLSSESSVGVAEEYVGYGSDLLPSSAVGSDGLQSYCDYLPGADLPSSIQIGSGQPRCHEAYSYGDQDRPWAVSSILHSAPSGETWRIEFEYGGPHSSLASASDGEDADPFAPQATTSWNRDPLGNPTSISQSSAAIATMAYSDQYGARLFSSLSYGDGAFSYSHDSYGRPVSLSYAEGNQTPTLLASWSYDGFGRMTQAGPDSLSYADDGSIAGLASGPMSIVYSSYGPHAEGRLSFGDENPAVIASHGPEACSYADPGLSKAIFQLIPGLLSTVFEGDPLSESPAASWEAADADLELRHSGGSLPPASSEPFAQLERHGSAACLRQVANSSGSAHLRYEFFSSGVSGGAPGISFGAWLRPNANQGTGTLLQFSLGRDLSGLSESSDSALVLRMTLSGVELTLRSSQGNAEETLISVSAETSAWHFVCVSLHFSGAGNTLESVSFRMDSVTRSASPPSSFPNVAFPSLGSGLELSVMGPARYAPFTPLSDRFAVAGLAYAPFVTFGGRALSDDEISLAYRETRKALLGGADPLVSPLAARTFLKASSPSGFEAIAPLEGGFSLLTGSLGPSRVAAPSGPMARAGDLFRFDPVEHRFRYFSQGEALRWDVPLGGEPACLAFCFRPAALVEPPAERVLCSVYLGISFASVVLIGSSLYLRHGQSDDLIGTADGSSSMWLGVEFWEEERQVFGNVVFRTAGIRVRLGDGSSFSSKTALLDTQLPDSASVELGGGAKPFLGYVDRLGIWLSAWSSSKVSALQAAFSSQKASVEGIDPFGELSSRSIYGPSGLSVSSSFTPLAEERLYDSPLLRLGLVGSEETEVNGTPVASLDRQYVYDALGRLTETYAPGDEPGVDDPIESYAYDGLGRLKSWTDPAGDTLQYIWENGHITKVKKGQLVTGAFSYSGHKALSAPGMVSFSYRTDAPFLIDRMSLPQIGLAPQAYAGLSYMGRTITGVTVQGNFPMASCQFSYDGLGRRVSKTSGGITRSYFYEGSILVRESISGSPGHDIRFFYHPSGAPAFMELDGVAYYYAVDAFGSVRALIDGNGLPVVTYSYDPWGKILSSTDTSGVGLAALNPFRYRSYYYDSETGWYLCGSRYYSPEWMRWMTPDSPDYLDPESVGGLDPYMYCYGNPVMYADPDGHEAIAISVGAIILILVAAIMAVFAVSEANTHLLANLATTTAKGLENLFEIVGNWISSWDFSWWNGLWPDLNNYEISQSSFSSNVMFSVHDPYARPGQKKQGRELKNKARARFPKKCKYRGGRKSPKHHTPGRDHRKFYWRLSLLWFNEWLDSEVEHEEFFQLD